MMSGRTQKKRKYNASGGGKQFTKSKKKLLKKQKREKRKKGGKTTGCELDMVGFIVFFAITPHMQAELCRVILYCI